MQTHTLKHNTENVKYYSRKTELQLRKESTQVVCATLSHQQENVSFYLFH